MIYIQFYTASMNVNLKFKAIIFLQEIHCYKWMKYFIAYFFHLLFFKIFYLNLNSHLLTNFLSKKPLTRWMILWNTPIYFLIILKHVICYLLFNMNLSSPSLLNNSVIILKPLCFSFSYLKHRNHKTDCE